MGCVFQDFRLLPKKSVYDNVAFALEVLNKPQRSIRRTVPEVLDLVGLDGKAQRMPNELSGGEQQRVAIARALITRPAIVLADEPTGNLDTVNSDAVLGMLHTSGREFNQTVLMITHNPEAAQIADRILHMRDGQITKIEAGRRRVRV
jgi:putative ABC transport system ATP-binding protein